MFRRRRTDEDFAREVDAHLQLEADRLVADGMDPDEARLAARKRFGNTLRAQERFYYARHWPWFDQLRQDVRTALRGIRRYPIACSIAVISLAGGIGATTTTLVMRDAIFVAPPPLYRDPGNLYAVRTATLRGARRLTPAALYRTWLQDALIRPALAASTAARPRDVRAGDRTDTAGVREVTANLFQQLGVRPAIGTPFDEWPADAQAPAMLSHAVWQRVFGGRPDVVGLPIFIDNDAHVVIGVMPERFWFASMDGPVWTRTAIDSLPGETPLEVVVRRPEGLIEAALFDRLRVGTDAYAAHLPADERQIRASAEPVHGTPLGNQIAPMIVLLLGSAALLTLLIACTNVAVLMMAQWTAREHEIAIRASLGGGRGRIVRSLLTESTLIAGAGGLLGVSLTFALRGLMIRSEPLARLYDMTIDPVVLLQSGFVTVAAGVLTGVAPAVYETRRLHVNPLNTIGGSDRVRQRWRHALVVFEIATTVALLVVTGAMLSSYLKSLNSDPGFDTHPILAARVDNPDGVPAPVILDRVRALPGVEIAEAATSVPFVAPATPTQRVSTEAVFAGELVKARRAWVGPQYFRALDVRVRAGRAIGEQDVASSPAIVVVNDLLAAELWPSEVRDGAYNAALGRILWIEEAPHQVVGVVAAFAHTAIVPPRPSMFTAFAQLQPAPPRVQIVIRTAGSAAAYPQSIRRDIASMGGNTTVGGVATIDQIMEIIGQEIMVGVYPLFPLIATGILLTAAGIYGVLAFAVTRRSTELAVRIAVGATGGDLLRYVAMQSVRLVGAGTVIGIGLTYALTRVAQGRGGIFDSPGWQAFVVPMLMIGLIAMAATWIPMRRALKINPSSLLRST